MLQIIFLSGRAGCGKDTLGKWLTNTHGYVRVAYADALKDEVAVKYGIPRDELDDPTLKDSMPPGQTETRREIMQRHGRERRGEDPDYWVDIARARMRTLTGNGARVVVTDARFPNEMTGQPFALRVRITRPALPITDTDESETALDNATFDLRLTNAEGAPEKMIADMQFQLDIIRVARETKLREAFQTLMTLMG
jgi:hypothetical protein